MMLTRSLRTFSGILIAVLLVFLAIFLLTPHSNNVYAQDAPLPATPPDAAAAQAVYAQRCALCHGDTGAADGQQALDAGLAPTIFADPDYRLTAAPTAMASAILNGNMAALMPPFGPGSSDPLSDTELWDLIALIYSFSTPAESIALGESLLAEQQPDWPDFEYWYTNSNEAVLIAMETGEFVELDPNWTDEEKLAVVDYGRSLTYTYVDAGAGTPATGDESAAPSVTIPSAAFQGNVVNGTNSSLVEEGTIFLRGFTTDFVERVTISTTIGTNGEFEFALEDVQSDLIFLSTVEYDGISFNSEAMQIDPDNPTLAMPITVFDTTTDPAAISIDQIHILMDFFSGVLQVSQLYVVSNNAPTVFVGEEGKNGLEIYLPEGATNIEFQRAFGSMTNLIPAPEVIESENGWVDTLPMRPGQGRTNLIVNYDLPYDDGIELSHPIAYPLTSATLMLPEAGVDVGGGGWVSAGAQETGMGDVFLTFANNDVRNASSIEINLEGEPERTMPGGQNNTLVRNENNELIIGGAMLAITLGAALFLGAQWRNRQYDEEEDYEAILYEIADLDDAYANGELGKKQYESQRRRLMDELIAIWPPDEPDETA